MLGFFAGRLFYGHHEAYRHFAEQQMQLARMQLEEWREVSGSKDVALNMANAELSWTQTEVARLTAENQELKEDLKLYRKVFSDRSFGDSLIIDSLRLSDTYGSGVYRFRVTLIQPDRFGRMAEGQISFSLQGFRSGIPAELNNWELMTVTDNSALQFNFRYLQTIEGLLQIPEDFEAERLEVLAVLEVKNRKTERVSQSYNWNSTLRAGF
ncbi:DUF6776 family protein [Echinimonas agarilytica]|uniref:Uncharacterized protein n=1 Tax=Echinimonas agarilytica TaxID=1215918 RepID=A0AA41W4S1_9GAMM|nr:DUF6776 family protein [Echinimonas agarilytica]MCM2678644.1 hypothetical protein [Echinimonas agarilytica]